MTEYDDDDNDVWQRPGKDARRNVSVFTRETVIVGLCEFEFNRRRERDNFQGKNVGNCRSDRSLYFVNGQELNTSYLLNPLPQRVNWKKITKSNWSLNLIDSGMKKKNIVFLDICNDTTIALVFYVLV